MNYPVACEPKVRGRLTPSRLFWRLAYPCCRIAFHVFGASYKWVNYGYGAWHPELYDPIWHHQHYADELLGLPDRVNIRGMGYAATAVEGLVIFRSRDCGSTITFDRDPHDQHAQLWYVKLNGNVPADHVEEAYRWVKGLFGGSFEKK